MVSTTQRRIPESADKPWSADLNRMIDVQLGQVGGQIKLLGYDGTITDPYTSAATAGQYALVIQSAAGLHEIIVNAAGSVTLLDVNDAGINIGAVPVTMGGALTVTGAVGTGALTCTTIHATAAATFDTTLSASGQISALATPTSIATSGLITIGTSLNVTTSAVIGTTLQVSGQISALATPISIATSGAINSGTSVTATTTVTATTGDITATAGDVVLTAGKIKLNAAASRIVPGATSFAINNNADAVSNFLLTNAGNATLVGSLTAGNAAGVGSGTIRVPNNGFIYSEETGGTDRALIGIDAGNTVRVGDYTSGAAVISVGGTTDVYLVAGSAAGNIVLQIQPAKLGLFGSAPNAKQTITGVTTGTLAQLQVVVRNMLAAWANHGAWTDSTT